MVNFNLQSIGGMSGLLLTAAAACGIALAIAYVVRKRSAGEKGKSSRSKPPPQKPLKGPVALSSIEKRPFKLVTKKNVSHDTRKFVFALQSKSHVLGLPVGNHMYLSALIGEERVSRPYTPISSNDEQGYFELVIKVYKANVHPKFPLGGKMSQHLDSLAIGDTVDIRGPSGKVVYLGQGFLKIKLPGKPEELRSVRNLGLIAGGTGLTPMYQIIKAILKDDEDDTHVSLLYANQTEEDILLRPELEKMEREGRNFKLWYTLDKSSEGWTYSSGFISDEMIASQLPAPGPDTQILMCGPPPMIKFACLPNLAKLGYTEDMFVAF